MRVAAAAVLALTAACSPVSPTPAPSADAIQITGSWLLVSGHGPDGPVPLVPDWPITLRVEGSALGGTSACNAYVGQLEPVDGRPAIREISGTQMGCGDHIMESEAEYLASLRRMNQMGIEGNELVVRGPDVELRFVPLPDAPVEALVGTEWVLQTMIVGDVAQPPAGAPATLLLAADGTFTGSTGCRSFSGTWIQQGHRVETPIMGMDQVECPLTLQAQDSHVVSVVGDGFVPSIQDGLLTLLDPGSSGLVYRAAE